MRLVRAHDRRGLQAWTNSRHERLLGKAKAPCWELNDEIWAEITTPAFAGEVKLGLPYDLVTTYLPPVLKTYAQAFPHVEISLVCLTSPMLAEALAQRRNRSCRHRGARWPLRRRMPLDRTPRLGGLQGRRGLLKRPLPISIVSDTCAFRPVVFDALRRQGLAWRSVYANGSVEAITATVLTDLAVTASLASTIPPGLDVLGSDSGLPELPSFAINLHLRAQDANPIAHGLAAPHPRRLSGTPSPEGGDKRSIGGSTLPIAAGPAGAMLLERRRQRHRYRPCRHDQRQA